LRVLFVGDVNGKPGRTCLEKFLAKSKNSGVNYDFIVANAENAAGGFGLTRDVSRSIFSLGVGCQTSGNHIWDKKEILSFFEDEPRLLRPANYPSEAPGHGYNIYELDDGNNIGVINLQGRIFMWNIDCPFKTADRIIPEIAEKANIIIVDFHAEATSEKQALGRYLDGRVSAVIGTHTHVQTADDRILPGGTAYVTDAGMTGPYDSVIGIEVEDALYRVITAVPNRFTVARGDVRFAGIDMEIDYATGKTLSMKRIFESSPDYDE
jgi:metallophosphoesterase (TIGR00282 family)